MSVRSLMDFVPNDPLWLCSAKEDNAHQFILIISPQRVFLSLLRLIIPPPKPQYLSTSLLCEQFNVHKLQSSLNRTIPLLIGVELTEVSWRAKKTMIGMNEIIQMEPNLYCGVGWTLLWQETTVNDGWIKIE